MLFRGELGSSHHVYGTGTTSVTFILKGELDLSGLLGKDLDIEAKLHRETRSLNANGYFHALVGKLAERFNVPKARMKNELVAKYGQPLFLDGDIMTLTTRIPPGDMALAESPHTAWVTTDFNGVSVYNVYRGTHTYTSKEMSALIEGTVADAREEGIETVTPDEAAKLVALWKPKAGTYF